MYKFVFEKKFCWKLCDIKWRQRTRQIVSILYSCSIHLDVQKNLFSFCYIPEQQEESLVDSASEHLFRRWMQREWKGIISGRDCQINFASLSFFLVCVNSLQGFQGTICSLFLSLCSQRYYWLTIILMIMLQWWLWRLCFMSVACFTFFNNNFL